MVQPVFTCSFPGGAILPFSPSQLCHCVCNLEKSYICMMCNCLSFRTITKSIFVPLQSSIPVARMGDVCGLIPPNKTSILPNWNNKHYKSGVFVKILAVKSPCTNVKTLIEDFLRTVLQNSMEDRKKLVIHLRSTWMTDRIRKFPVVQKQYFTNILHPQCGKDSCHPQSTFETTTSYNFLLVTVN